MSSRRRDRQAAAPALRSDSFQPRLGRISVQGGRFHENYMRATLPGVSLPCNQVSSRIPQRRFYAKGHAWTSFSIIDSEAASFPLQHSLPLLWQVPLVDGGHHNIVRIHHLIQMNSCDLRQKLVSIKFGEAIVLVNPATLASGE